ncbi:phenylalanine--tRNA ligase subunit beta [Tepidibacter formicigenes]|jgi:phenylalanyl-tRNA synthetase beta chain|uniref:Phenylalanine--tRNA ligase beta subunit n=1 Tax=Tepidibacter formicigenes DSM 15518 TaxID=1123349 RepID=A0A1M6KR23_9FIRM|nr:phenylalanine--tRNA ligase subunit beta [Tepidibacter formicigenes]SHJ61361.1 phenylalanyl-tRNA synthetase beta subunit [Tepidibacter formicigenes DSM 15518]
MLVPLKWLRDYVDIDINAQEFADKMTMTGSKVEKVENFGEDIEKVVVGKILEINKHPNADKLIVTKVDIGSEVVQIVTGAKNVKEGDLIPLALVGAKLPGGIKIKKGKLRGELSQGMMCSSEELGIPFSMIEESKRDGIYVLDEEYELGKDVKELLGINDSLIEFEITSNRPDCLSIIGIAREAAVTLNKELKYPKINVKESDEEIKFNIEIEDDALCPRYSARIIKDVKIGSSPYWMQRRLIEAGVRPINNIVDITNYVMLELGQPLHAFDLKELETDTIVVRKAKEGEKFTTLDDVERTLDENMLLITDGKKPVAIAGVMGGANSEVSSNTKEILLESANFNADSIRKTSKKLGLRTEASSRFEKGIDVNLVEVALNRAAQLIEEIGAGRVLKGFVDNYKNPVENKKIVVRPQRINKLLGENIPLNQFIEILESLEFKCSLVDDKLEIIVPSFRLDIDMEADILEEIARIYGYDNIPSKMIYGTTTMGLKTIGQIFEENIKNSLVAMGLNEILTYSFVSSRGVDKINMPEHSIKRNFIKIMNPLGEETSVMRTTLLPNMLDVASRNYSRKVEEFAGFEIGNTFMPMDNIMPVEKKSIALGLYRDKMDFFFIKGIIEELFESIGFKNYEIIPEKNHPTFHPGRCANIVYNDNIVGVFGELHPDVLENYDINTRMYAGELDFELLLTFARDNKTYKPLPKYPAITRDIALLVKDEVFVKEIEDVIKENSKGLVESFKLFDVYKGAQIEEGYKSVAYSIVYRSKDKTLTDEEVNKVHDNIVKELSEKINANLRL